MTLAQHAAKSVSDARILVELDIGQVNVQWVNLGAGLWAVDANNLYPWVDASLLDGFTAQDFTTIGSVQVEGVHQTDAGSMLDLVAVPETYWYDATEEKVWIHLINHDAPSLHYIVIGVIYGYSFDDITPVGATQLYEGRLLGAPVITKRRDPLYFGKISFGGGAITLANGDGELDRWAEDNDIYGNQARVYIGYAQLDIDDYQCIYTGSIERVRVSEDNLVVTIADRRKLLTAPITYTCTALNALDAIVEILTGTYNVAYTSVYFDTTAWASAQASVETVSINMQQPDSVINVIEGICRSVFGVFFVTADNLFSFRRVDTSASSQATIKAVDIRNRHTIDYDPTQVISSLRVGYSKDWVTASNPYTYVTNTTYQASVFNTYKTYNQRDFLTDLHTLTAATAYGETLMLYSKDVHGQFDVETPMAYYARDVGEVVDAEVIRARTGMLGTVRSEILDVRYNLATPSISFGLRIV